MRVQVLCIAVLVLAGCGSRADTPAKDYRAAGTAADNQNLVIQVTDRMYRALEKDGANESELLRSATKGQRYVYALASVQGEIDNGGFDQLFFNSTGSLYRLALEGAVAMRIPQAVKLMRAAQSLFPHGVVPVDRADRQRQLDRLSQDRLSALDDRWYDADAAIDLGMRRYILAHPKQFFRR